MPEREKFGASLVPDQEEIFETLGHEKGEGRAFPLQQRIGSARGRETEIDFGKRLAKAGAGEDADRDHGSHLPGEAIRGQIPRRFQAGGNTGFPEAGWRGRRRRPEERTLRNTGWVAPGGRAQQSVKVPPVSTRICQGWFTVAGPSR
jgi:hypothetical protein